MFGTKTSEFTKDYKTLFESRLDPSTFSVYGYKLGDFGNFIDQSMIMETTFHENPEGITQTTYRDGKVFYELDGKTIEHLLKDRIESVLSTDGWLQMKEGYSIRIEKQVIVEFMLGKILPLSITDIPKAKIRRKFGEPSDVKENYENIDGSLFTTDFNYNRTKLRISYDDWDKKISHINIGEPKKRITNANTV